MISQSKCRGFGFAQVAFCMEKILIPQNTIDIVINVGLWLRLRVVMLKIGIWGTNQVPKGNKITYEGILTLKLTLKAESL